MGRRAASSILITEIYEGSTRRISVFDETTGNMRARTLQQPCSHEQAQAIKQELITEVKEMAHAKSDRRSKTSMPESAPALPNTALDPQPA